MTSFDAQLEDTTGNERVWHFRTIFNCTEACGRDPHHQVIGEVKKAVLQASRDIPVRHAAGAHHR